MSRSHFDPDEFDADSYMDRFTFGQIIREFAPQLTRESQLKLADVLKELAKLIREGGTTGDQSGLENN